jgi:hypothetical protein
MSESQAIHDTSPDAQRVLIACYRQMPAARKWRILLDAYRTARALHESGFRARHRDADSRMIQSDWRRTTFPSKNLPEMSEAIVDPASLDNLPVLSAVVAAFRELQISCALGGSWASSLLGVPRFTQDADLTVEPFPGRESQLVAKFGPDYYVSESAVHNAVRDRSTFNIIHLPSGFKVDVFVRNDSPFARSAFDRRRPEMIPGAGATVDVYSPEDMILIKLDWYRQTDESSDRQWGDVLGVLRVQGERLDNDYLDHWARELGLTDLLTRARSEAAV